MISYTEWRQKETIGWMLPGYVHIDYTDPRLWFSKKTNAWYFVNNYIEEISQKRKESR
nr:MAG TPA: hypothetical protein [Caudoviricetes sp.]